MKPVEWERITSEMEQDFSIIRLRRDRSVSPRTGVTHEFLVLESREWVIVLAVTADGEAVLIHQYRHGAQKVTMEMPGGLVDDGMTPLEAAQAELRQEAGYDGGEWHHLGTLLPMPALFATNLHVFLARGVQLAGDLDLDAAEDIEVELVPLSDVRRLVAEGAFAHAQMVACLYLYDLWCERTAGVARGRGAYTQTRPVAEPGG